MTGRGAQESIGRGYGSMHCTTHHRDLGCSLRISAVGALGDTRAAHSMKFELENHAHFDRKIISFLKSIVCCL